MTFFARIVRFLFWLLVASWGMWLLRRFVAWLLGSTATTSQQATDASSTVESPSASRRLVRDPVCGMHVDETLSIPLRTGSELMHFCSLACRDKYAGNVEKMAANG